MKNRLLSTACVILACATLTPAGAFAAQRATVYRAESGAGLTAPSQAAPDAVVRAFVAAQGRDASTLAPDGAPRVGANGVTHVRYTQSVGGYRVAGASLKASIDAQGRLIFVADNLADVSAGVSDAARIDARQALQAAMTHHGYSGAAALREAGRQGEIVRYERGQQFHQGPSVERVVMVDADNRLRTGFEVMTWSQAGNRLHYTLVDGNGQVASVESRTNNDSYNVFAIDPLKSAQAVAAGPGAGNAQSPIGWLNSGAQKSINIAGNNVNAYLDASPSNNRPDSGGVSVTDGNFLAVANLLDQPSTAANRDVAVQNLFYLNNVTHDLLYQHGFTEAAGNFQNDNFGLGGKGRDAVNAEAQDGSGTDNANFSTPRDGSAPRMQMFLWTAPGANHEVIVNAPSPAAFDAAGAVFGPALDTLGVTGDVALVNDGVGTTSDACDGGGAGLSGKIALIDRGTCAFVDKVINAQAAGAIGVIIANNGGGDEIFTMGGDSKRVRIPSVLVSQNSGAALKANLSGLNATERRKPNAAPMIDADLDSDIVYHEYGHGLTWRMIGGMSGPMAGAIGEGASDGVSLLVNGDDVVGEYSFSNPNGIRRFPYTNYPLTYGAVNGGEVHNDGEVYAAIIWRLSEIFAADSAPKTRLLDLFVDGMNFTPSTPAFEDMRDGMLQSAAVAGNGDECRIWSAFAQYGVGVGASGTTSAPITIVESFAKPAECLP